MKQALLVTFACMVPLGVHASVFISEVAWMGTPANANAEWIELYNDGPAVDLAGWTLSATDGQPTITLSGVLGANSYALLERTNDDAVSSVPAFLVYTGSMGNTGEVLELRDASSVLVDRVDGSNDWAIGGNNDTKETLQRSGTPPIGGFITAAPTPQGSSAVLSQSTGGGTSSTSESAADTSGSASVSTKTASGKGGGGVLYGKPSSGSTLQLEPALTVVLPEERVVTVGVANEFHAQVFRESGREAFDASLTWNFGDGATEEGATPSHTYHHPGTYVVTLVATRAWPTRTIEASARMTVRAIAPEAVITHADASFIELHNTADKELDISGFALVSGGTAFRIPPGTIVLPGTRVRFPASVTRLVPGLEGTQLLHPSGVMLARYGGAVEAPRPPRTAGIGGSVVPPKIVSASDEVSADDDATAVVPNEIATIAYAFEGAGEEGSPGGALPWWVLGAVVTTALAVLVVVLTRREEREIIEGFEIESDE